MKLLVNKNCSGYHWFECDLVGDEQYINMFESQPVNQVSSLLGGLRIYGQFEYCLIRDNGEYILAINNIHGQEKDIFDRPISIKLIFVGKENEAQLLLKILLNSLEDFGSFAKIMYPSFESSSMSDPIYVRCDWEKLRAFFEGVKTKVLDPMAEKLLDNSAVRLIAVSRDNSVAMGKMGFSDEEIDKADISLSSLNIEQYFLPLLIKNLEKEEKSRFGSEGFQPKLEELQNILRCHEERITSLDRTLNTTKSEFAQFKVEFTHQNRLLNSLIAVLGAIIIILIIIYMLK